MDVKKYEVLDETGCVIATGMSLITALMVMEHSVESIIRSV